MENHPWSNDAKFYPGCLVSCCSLLLSQKVLSPAEQNDRNLIYLQLYNGMEPIRTNKELPTRVENIE